MSFSRYHDGWYESPNNYDDFSKQWSDSGLVIPFIPEPLRTGLLAESDRGLFWSTSREVHLHDLYQLNFYGRRLYPLPNYLQSGRENFFMTALPGGRFNGIVARLGPLFVAHALERYDRPSGAERVRLANRCNEAWNTTAAQLEPHINEDIRVAVIYSLPYGLAQIWKKVSPGAVVHNPAVNNGRLSLSASVEGSDAWDIIATSSPTYSPENFDDWNVWRRTPLEERWRNFQGHLEHLIQGPDEVMQIAARHLIALPGFDEIFVENETTIE